MRLLLTLTLVVLLTSCGYHLVGQGKSNVIPEQVVSASLTSQGAAQDKALLAELRQAWIQRKSLPVLQDKTQNTQHVSLRIESASEVFTPVAFNVSGLAIQYRLSVSASLKMYQNNALIWQSGLVVSSADIFGDAAALTNNPASIEAERETLLEQLRKQWAQDALARLQSGF
ncbi:MAG TPA: hypothetical protein EYP39_05650 [Ghiorsea sp.]|nr:hypothetical protein [Ghiorsea sp.]